MQINYITILACIYPALYAWSITLELKGYEIRHLNTHTGVALAYFTQQKYLYFSRFGPLLSLPILGYLIDKKVSMGLLLGIIMTSHLLTFILNKKFLRKNRLDKINVILWTIAFFIHSGSIHILTFAASKYNTYKATILLSSPIINGIGTTIIVFFVERKLSNEIDSKSDSEFYYAANQDLRVKTQIFWSVVYGAIYLTI